MTVDRHRLLEHRQIEGDPFADGLRRVAGWRYELDAGEEHGWGQVFGNFEFRSDGLLICRHGIRARVDRALAA